MSHTPIVPPGDNGNANDGIQAGTFIMGRLTCEKCARQFLVVPEDLWAVNGCPFCLERLAMGGPAGVQ